jgi:hypothetical protein
MWSGRLKRADQPRRVIIFSRLGKCDWMDGSVVRISPFGKTVCFCIMNIHNLDAS